MFFFLKTIFKKQVKIIKEDKVAKFIGKSRAHVSNCLRLLSLPQKIIEHISNEKISQGHAKILVGIENAELLAEKIISKKKESLIQKLKKFKIQRIRKQ